MSRTDPIILPDPPGGEPVPATSFPTVGRPGPLAPLRAALHALGSPLQSLVHQAEASHRLAAKPEGSR